MSQTSRTFFCRTCHQLSDGSRTRMNGQAQRLCGMPLCKGQVDQISELGKFEFLESLFAQVDQLPASLRNRLIEATGASQ